jgi:ribose 5-phosphate isomerase B
MAETIAFAADHGGYELKAALVPIARELGYEVLDLGTMSRDSVDYPDFADALAAALKDGRAQKGVLVCGTGLGISIAANRHRHIRATPCHDHVSARLARAHNDANVLALGGRIVGLEVARDCLEVFLKTPYEGGRHQRRLDKFS